MGGIATEVTGTSCVITPKTIVRTILTTVVGTVILSIVICRTIIVASKTV